MKLKNLLIGSSVGLAFFGLYLHSSVPTSAASKQITILNNAFSESIVSVTAGDTVVWLNNDAVGHRLDVLNASDSSVVVGSDLDPKVSTSTAGRTLSRKFNSEGSFKFRLDHQSSISGDLIVFPSLTTPTVAPTATPVVTATPSATATASATPTESPTATPSATPVVTATPSATPVVTATPSASPSATPTESPTATPTATPVVTPTVTPTTSPTEVPTATPTATPVVTVSPTPTVVPTATPTATPVVTPTVTPSPTIVPTVTPTPTVVPTVSPTITPTVTPTATPVVTPTPTPTPVGEVLPLFSVFRRTTCTAALINNNTQVRTDRVDAVTLLRGTWNVQSLNNNPPNVSLQAQLVSVRSVNLLFGSNPFFGLDRTVSANKTATFTSTSVNGVLQKASDAWCAQ